MPELPEVETITTRLKPFVVGKKITSVDLLHPRPLQGNQQDIVGLEITDVTRRAKTVRIHLSKQLNLLVHLKMTGQLIYVSDKQKIGGGHPTGDWISELPTKHTRLAFKLDDLSTLYFNDQRLFGWIKVIPTNVLEPMFAKLPPDVVDPEFTFEYFDQILNRKGVPIKVAIMDSALMGGVGNIYACDALNKAKISPWKPAKTLTEAERKVLYQAIIDTINMGIRLGGATTDGKYVDVSGFAGSYQTVSRVYDKAGAACQNCRTPIEKEKLAGRGTYFCPSCQK